MATGRLPDPNTAPLTAKGDLYTYTTRGARQAVGNDGETLVADSSATTGLRWQGSRAAGRNFAINGGFDIWQRGTSIGPISSVTQYTADRWYAYLGATPYTFSRQTSDLTGFQYSLRMQRTSGNSTTNLGQIWQAFETVNSIPLAGQTVTLSFYAKAGANFSPTSSAFGYTLLSGTGTDQKHDVYTGSSTLLNSTVTLTTSWQRFSFNVAVGSTATELAIGFTFSPTGTAGTNDWFEVTGVQLEVGSVATQFSRTGGTLAGELAACQRYYERIVARGGATVNYSGVGHYYNTTDCYVVQNYVTKRTTTPTMTFSSNTDFTANSAGANRASTLVAADIVAANAADYYIRTASVTAGASAVAGISNAAGWIAIEAEL